LLYLLQATQKEKKRKKKKKTESCPSNQVSAAAMTKNGALSIAFSVQETSGRPIKSVPENRVDDQDNGSQGRPVSSG
jgi:hypothetical protein